MKKQLGLLIGFIILMFFAVTAWVQGQQPQAEEPPEIMQRIAEETSSQQNAQKTQRKILEIQEVISDNGIKSWLVEDHSLPIIALQFSFKNAGSIQDSVDKQGLARLLSNTMDEGAGDLDAQEFQKTLSDNSITLYFNSGRDNFGGQLKTLSRKKEMAFDLLKLALTQPRFDDEPLARMKQANISRIKNSKGQPDWIGARLFNDVSFENHPYALNSGGTITSLENITKADLKQRHATWLTKEDLVIAVSGNITPEELKKALDDVFGGLPDYAPENKISSFSLQNTGNSYLYKKDIPQTLITVALPSIAPTDPDYYALRLLNFIYGGGGFGSNLMEEAREKRGLTYGIYSSLINQDYINYMTISTSTKNESAGEMMGIIKDEMLKIRDTSISDQKLIDAKSYLIGSMPLGLTSTDKISSTLLSLQLNKRDINYLDNLKRNINKVTIEDLENVAKRLYNPENFLTMMVGNPAPLETNIIELKDLPNVE